MAIALLGSGSPGASANANNVSIPCTIVAGTNRLLFVSIQTRGNAGSSDVTLVQLRSGMTPVASLFSVSDVEANNILHCEYYALLDAGMPAPGAYTVYIEANSSPPGAFATSLSYALFDQCSQTYTPVTAQATNAGGSSISLGITTSTSGLIIDNWAGEGSGAVKALAGNNTGYFQSQATATDLRGVSGYYFAPGAGTYAFSWSGSFHNRNAIGAIFWAAAVTPPTTGISVNINWMGAQF